MKKAEKWMAAVMVLTAVAGTIWYLAIELQNNEAGTVGWSLIAVIWFVVIRRLVHLRAQVRRRREREEEF